MSNIRMCAILVNCIFKHSHTKEHSIIALNEVIC